MQLELYELCSIYSRAPPRETIDDQQIGIEIHITVYIGVVATSCHRLAISSAISKIV
jgi:hypothetical protein